MGKEEMKIIAGWIVKVISHIDDRNVAEAGKRRSTPDVRPVPRTRDRLLVSSYHREPHSEAKRVVGTHNGVPNNLEIPEKCFGKPRGSIDRTNEMVFRTEFALAKSGTFL